MSYTVILYTHLPPTPFLTFCHQHLNAATLSDDYDGIIDDEPDRIVVSSEPYPTLPGWRNIVARGERGLHDCYVKSLAGATAARFDTVYLVEHDVLYPRDYFSVKPQAGVFSFNTNVYIQNLHGFWLKPVGAKDGRMYGVLTSNCVASRDLLTRLFTLRLDHLAKGGRVKWDEPGLNYEECPAERDLGGHALWRSPNPVVDIRWGENLTGDRKAPGDNYMLAIPYWGLHDDLWRKYGLEAKA